MKSQEAFRIWQREAKKKGLRGVKGRKRNNREGEKREELKQRRRMAGVWWRFWSKWLTCTHRLCPNFTGRRPLAGTRLRKSTERHTRDPQATVKKLLNRTARFNFFSGVPTLFKIPHHHRLSSSPHHCHYFLSIFLSVLDFKFVAHRQRDGNLIWYVLCIIFW